MYTFVMTVWTILNTRTLNFDQLLFDHFYRVRFSAFNLFDVLRKNYGFSFWFVLLKLGQIKHIWTQQKITVDWNAEICPLWSPLWQQCFEQLQLFVAIDQIMANHNNQQLFKCERVPAKFGDERTYWRGMLGRVANLGNKKTEFWISCNCWKREIIFLLNRHLFMQGRNTKFKFTI